MGVEDGAVDDGASAAAQNEDDEQPETLTIETVTRICLGKRQWLPPSEDVGNKTFVTFSKGDSTLCLLVTGKGIVRHSTREAHDLNVRWWGDVKHLSNSLFA